MCGSGFLMSPPPVWLARSPGSVAGPGSVFAAWAAVGGWVWASSGGANQNIAKVAQIRGFIEVVLLRPLLRTPLDFSRVNQLRHRPSHALRVDYSKFQSCM